ncbi:hypothetical protein JCM16775_0571 [Leptotrichia hofstadii]|uniref:Uncharacterized protein n=1 Tax=Leptotrichia hofstadii TaxID=157688 RepID=A0A510JFH9_9FUSO|nr:hypothetical protein [Leptotrichia hofstadii]BBM37876.1 hypothetical protein JCM16775_0571 [Leptotrichia hofstadii]
MNELVTKIGKEPKESITSLELLELINKFRIEDGNKTKLEHKDLLKAIRNEFRKQIGEGKISPTSYKDNWNRNQPKFDLTLKQSLRLLTKESIEVREKVFDYIEKLEKQNQMLRQALWNRQNNEWLLTRKQGKITRRKETDAIAVLIPYAKSQGSNNADRLYIVYSRLVNRLAGVDDGTRETVDVETLLHIKKLEDLFSKVIFESMEKQLFYKDIYGKCKALGYQLMQFMKLDMPNIYKINENQKQLGLM